MLKLIKHAEGFTKIPERGDLRNMPKVLFKFSPCKQRITSIITVWAEFHFMDFVLLFPCAMSVYTGGDGCGGGLVTKSCLTLGTPWTVACQAPLSVRFPRQQYWNLLLFPSPH